MWIVIALLAAFLAGPDDEKGRLTDEQRRSLSQYFGFSTFEIYKLEMGIFQLRLADLNGDGRGDIVLWNYRKSRFEIFYSPSPDAAAASKPAEQRERNELPDRGNLRNETVSVAYRVASLEVADLTADKRPDLVFFGEPKELVILPGKQEGGFGAPITTRAPDGDARPGALAVGDFNSDGRTDVALLGDEILLVYYQKPDGGLAAPARFNHGVKQTQLALTGDLNGDGKDDLLIGVDDDEYGALALIQEAGGLGPIRRVRVPRLRSITISHAKGGDDVFSVESATGRLKEFHWEPPAAAAASDWAQILYSYPVRSKSKLRPVAFGDCNNDGFVDAVIADPDTAQLLFYKGGAGGLETGVAFPGLSKTLDVQIGDIDGDGKNEVLSISREEKMAAVSRFEDGRLTFPVAIPFSGTPLAAAIGEMRPGDADHVLAVLSIEKGADEKDEKRTQISILNTKDRSVRTTVSLKNLEDDPRGIRFVDVNQDGRTDLLLFVRFAPLQTFLQNENGSFVPLSGPETRESLVKESALEDFDTADVTGDGKPEVLLAQKTLARALIVRENHWEVVDQYNPESSDSELKGLAVLPGPDGNPLVAIYDRKDKNLLVFHRRADKAWGVMKTMPVGSFDPTALQGTKLGGGQMLVLADPQKLAVMIPGMPGSTLVEKRSFETKIKDGRLTDCVVGDLNGDGVRDVAALETAKANVEILTTAPNGELVKALHFQVFQGKRFSDAPDARGDPREAAIGDVTGDGRDDLILIAHDRLIVYPSE
ncbi:MAG: VCBS repeat-containing protein [Planctomycetes bacterium]|nr:VCBS repeat-containing protein [Planctomycetota bacterium]